MTTSPIRSPTANYSPSSGPVCLPHTQAVLQLTRASAAGLTSLAQWWPSRTVVDCTCPTAKRRYLQPAGRPTLPSAIVFPVQLPFQQSPSSSSTATTSSHDSTLTSAIVDRMPRHLQIPHPQWPRPLPASTPHQAPLPPLQVEVTSSQKSASHCCTCSPAALPS